MTSKKQKDKKFKKQVIILSSIAVLVLILNSLMSPKEEVVDPSVIALESNKGTSEIFKGDSTFDNELVNAYRKAYNSEYEAAFSILSKISKDNLSDNDVSLLIQVYDQTGNLHLLLDELPGLANDVITYLFTRDKLQGLPDIAAKMETKNPYIEFEQSYLTQGYDYMLTLVDSIQINGRKEQQIIEAYLALEQLEDARKFAEDVGNPDLIKRVEQYRK